MSRASKRNHTKSWRDRQTYIRTRRQADAMAERLGGGTNELYMGSNLVCPLCGYTLDRSKRLKLNDSRSPHIAYHEQHPTCPNAGKGWLLPRTYCKPVPQADVDAMVKTERAAWMEQVNQDRQQMSQATAKGLLAGTASAPNAVIPYTYTYRYSNGKVSSTP